MFVIPHLVNTFKEQQQRKGNYSSFKSYPSFPNKIVCQKNKKNFRIWKTRLNFLVLNKIRQNVDNLPDNDYWDMFVNDYTPEDVCEIVCNKYYYSCLENITKSYIEFFGF